MMWVAMMLGIVLTMLGWLAWCVWGETPPCTCRRCHPR